MVATERVDLIFLPSFFKDYMMIDPSLDVGGGANESCYHYVYHNFLQPECNCAKRKYVDFTKDSITIGALFLTLRSDLLKLVCL